MMCGSAGAVVGILAAMAALDPQFIVGAGGKWLRPDNDFNSYLGGLELLHS